jgi:predicted dehydrogenase
MEPVKLLIVGAGGRGTTYAGFAQAFPERAQVVGVAEPRDAYRERLVREHAIPSAQVFTDWREAAERPKFADAVIIATQDQMHVEPAVAFADLGYAMLLEKPMAPDAEGCRTIVDAVKRNDVLFGVCHVLRYTRFTQRLKAIIDSGAIGEVVGLQHLEPVGFWHMAHSFVRGNWRNEAESGPMLLTKSCHDLDWISYVMGEPWSEVSSFGSLYHFRPEQAPVGAGERCVACAVEAACPYSALRIYGAAVRRGHTGWPLDVLTPDPTPASVQAALETGPYGRCVYHCDNDVVDHQIANISYASGKTATFTMQAFTRMRNRETHVFGTRGELAGDGRFIDHYDFLTDTTERLDTEAGEDGTVLAGHGGGDFGLMDAFVQAVAVQDPAYILSGADETLASHLLVFAAEQARRAGQVVRSA